MGMYRRIRWITMISFIFYIATAYLLLVLDSSILSAFDRYLPPPDADKLKKTFSFIQEDSCLEDGRNKQFDFLINEENLCWSQEDGNLVMLVAVFSAVTEEEERAYVRSHWGAAARLNPKLRIVFIVGRPENPTQHMSTLRNESNVHRDIIVADYTDTYRTLMYKSFALFHWVTRYCKNANYVLKIDSDMYVELNLLLHKLETTYIPSSFLCGAMWPYAYVIRDSRSKWYVSEEEYPYKKYPGYCPGPAFVLPRRIVRKFSSIPVPSKPFPVDDVFITGILRTITQEEATEGLFSFDILHDDSNDFHHTLSNGQRIKRVHVS